MRETRWETTKRWLLRGVLTGVVAAGGLTVVIFARTMLVGPAPPPGSGAPPSAFPESGAVERLVGALRLSSAPPEASEALETGRVDAFRRYLERSFPSLHETLRREDLPGPSLLYVWEGTRSELAPVLLLGAGNIRARSQPAPEAGARPPFEEVVDGGYVRGRGVREVQGPLLALLEAVDGLVRRGFRPERTVLLALGRDTRTGQAEAAEAMAGRLAERGFRPEWILAEGGAVTTGALPGVRQPVALVGVTEKGRLSLELLARGPEGDPAVPPERTAAGSLARAVAALQRDSAPPPLHEPIRELLAQVGPHADPGTRMLVANLWLFAGPVAEAFSADPLGAAVLRTTVVATHLETAASREGVPGEARAILEVGLAPWDSPAAAQTRMEDRIRRELGEDVMGGEGEVEVELRFREAGTPVVAPAPIPSTDAPGYQALRRAIHRTFPDVVTVAPWVTPRPTSARHYSELSGNMYRFIPLRTNREDLEYPSGADDRLSVEGYLQMVRFYAELLQEAGSSG